MARGKFGFPGVYNSSALTLTNEEGSALATDISGNLLVRGSVYSTSIELTRPADTTAYTANDVVSNATDTTTPLVLANFGRLAGASGYIVGAKLTTNLKSITPRFRVHLFNVNTATVAADNAAYKEVYADISKRISSFDLAAMSTGADTTNSDMSRSMDMTLRIPFVLAAASTTAYAVLETLDGFTPASGEKFTLTIICDQN